MAEDDEEDGVLGCCLDVGVVAAAGEEDEDDVVRR